MQMIFYLSIMALQMQTKVISKSQLHYLFTQHIQVGNVRSFQYERCSSKPHPCHMNEVLRNIFQIKSFQHCQRLMKDVFKCSGAGAGGRADQ